MNNCLKMPHMPCHIFIVHTYLCHDIPDSICIVCMLYLFIYLHVHTYLPCYTCLHIIHDITVSICIHLHNISVRIIYLLYVIHESACILSHIMHVFTMIDTTIFYLYILICGMGRIF